MPYKSKAQRAKFHVLEAEGKLPAKTVKEWDDATGDAELPMRVHPKKHKPLVWGTKK